MSPTTRATARIAITVLKPTGTPVFGSGVRSIEPATLIPITRTTTTATTPTSARTHADAMRTSCHTRADTWQPGLPPPCSVLRRAGRRQASDAFDEAPEELVRVGLDRHVHIRLSAPHAAPVRHGLAGREHAADLDIDRDGLRPNERRVEGRRHSEGVVDERSVEAVVPSVELHVEPQRVGDIADDRVARDRAGGKHRVLAAGEGERVVRRAPGGTRERDDVVGQDPGLLGDVEAEGDRPPDVSRRARCAL